MPAVYAPENREDELYDQAVQRELDDEMLPEITFDEAEHAYYLNGARVPSVTEILKPIQTVGGSEEVRDFKRAPVLDRRGGSPTTCRMTRAAA